MDEFFERLALRAATIGRHPKVTVIDECSNQVGRQAGHLRRNTGSFGSGQLVPIRKQQKSGDHYEPDCDRDQLCPREKGHRVPNQTYERERAHAAKTVLSASSFMLLTVQSNKERQEQDQI